MLYHFWRFVGSFRISEIVYQKSRDFLLWVGIAKHSGRQNYSFGYLKKKYTKKHFEKNLIKKGFEWSYYS